MGLPPVLVKYRPSTDDWIVLAVYRYLGCGIELQIPEGRTTDLSSIPRFLWWLIAPFELSIEAPVVHDELYRNGGRHLGGVVDRATADWIFREIMIAERVPAWRYTLAYRGVRLFGRWRWRP